MDIKMLATLKAIKIKGKIDKDGNETRQVTFVFEFECTEELSERTFNGRLHKAVWQNAKDGMLPFDKIQLRVSNTCRVAIANADPFDCVVSVGMISVNNYTVVMPFNVTADIDEAFDEDIIGGMAKNLLLPMEIVIQERQMELELEEQNAHPQQQLEKAL